MGQFLKTYQILYKKSVVDLNSAKVIIDFNKIKYKNTHDLKNLTNLLENYNMYLEKIGELLSLSVYAVDGRYDMIQDDVGDIYINILDNLTVSIKNILKEENRYATE